VNKGYHIIPVAQATTAVAAQVTTIAFITTR